MNRPIGIFDSGIGGLAVARAVKDLLPEEQIIYFGDTARMPYGVKPSATIQTYTYQICDFLLQQHCKLILIACNSAASATYSIQDRPAVQTALLMNVIDPMIDHIVHNFPGATIGLIGTQQTIEAGIYQEKIHDLAPTIQLQSLPTPQLIAMIEAGMHESTTISAAIEQHLQTPALQHIQALVLGCTHYSFIISQLEKFYAQKVHLLDNALLTAHAVHKLLSDQQLLSQHRTSPDYFFASKRTPNFEAVVRNLFDQPVHLQHLPT